MGIRAALLAMALAGALAIPTAGEAPPRARAGVAAPDFELRILPILTKIGCNSGQCHGAAGGQAGFALSLRGYDPDADHDAITRERGARRIDLADPERSLLLRKPSMRIPHKGGRKLKEGSSAYEEVLAWIEAGAPRRSGRERSAVSALEIEPARTLGIVGSRFAIRVRARLADGALTEVTDACLYSSNDESVARVEGDGTCEIAGSGETAILVKFLGAVGSARVGAPYGAPYEPKDRASRSEIDRLVGAKLGEMGIAASGPCDDAAFLRRACLDLAGRLPEPQEVRAFLADPDPNKRAALVDRLLASPRAVERWTRWLADLCRVRGESMGSEGAARLHEWLAAGLRERRPLDAVARELVTAAGEPWKPGPAAFGLATAGPSEQMEFVTRTFLGYRLQCAQCHQHPFDRWSRQDYFGAAAFFARVRREQGRIVLATFGEYLDPKTGREAKPKFPGGDEAAIPEGADRREAFADWLLDRDALRFDRAIANRLWKELLGRGLAEPVDDLRATNPPTNPELLDALAREFREGGRDLFRYLAFVAKSEVYGRSGEALPGAERDARYFSHALLRPLPAAVLLDAIAEATGAKPNFPGAPGAERAQQIADEDGGSFTLRAFGRCPRDGSVDPAGAPPATIPMALHLLHGPLAGEWLATPGGRLARLSAGSPSPDAVVDELFLATLSRPPRPEERSRARDALGTSFDRGRVEDLFWALLATSEFATNH